MLYAQAAFLSELKGSCRRAALWYLVAGDKLEKTGIVSIARIIIAIIWFTAIASPETASNVLFP